MTQSNWQQKFCGTALCAVLTLIGFQSPAAAQTAAVYASGLENPSRVILGPNGYLLVTEATATANTGRVSLLDTGGNRRTLLDGLPSGPAAPTNLSTAPTGSYCRVTPYTSPTARATRTSTDPPRGPSFPTRRVLRRRCSRPSSKWISVTRWIC